MGGKDVPASGFALYLERLMALIKPKALAQPQPPRVLVKADETRTKEGFALVRRLHEAGYRAECYLGAQKESDFDWTVEVKDKAKFVLTNVAKKQKVIAQSVDELLGLLRK